MLFFSGSKHRKFLSTPSARRATRQLVDDMLLAVISIHALREEGDAGAAYSATTTAYFYPRPPRGGRPEGCHVSSRPWVFLSTPSARRAT